MSIVTIIGAGMMGSAMCWPLADNGHEIRLVGTPLDDDIIHSIRHNRMHPKLRREIPNGVKAYPVADLPHAVNGAEFIIGGISSFGVEWFAQTAGAFFRPEVPVISVTKGMRDGDDGRLQILPDVVNEHLPEHLRGRVSLNAIAGPCIAHELAARRQTCVAFTGLSAETLETIRRMLATPYYHIWTSTDLLAVETCAALKNAYAMGVGLAVGMMEAAGPDGLANMYNPQAGLFGQSCYEMRKLISVLNIPPGANSEGEAVAWLPGAGDLYVTVFGGRTVRLGKLLGQGKTFTQAREILAGETLESVDIITRVARALPKLATQGRLDLSDFPLILHMDQVINQGQMVNIPWKKFFHQA